jgi:hypothetical protein
MIDTFGPMQVDCPVCKESVYATCHHMGSAQHCGCSKGHHFYNYAGSTFTDEDIRKHLDSIPPDEKIVITIYPNESKTTS